MRKIYQPNFGPPERVREWVDLGDGEVCVWSMTAAEFIQLTDRATRPAIDPRGGVDTGALVLFQIIFSCYDGDEDNAKRIWGDVDLVSVGSLKQGQVEDLLAAINRVNGKDASSEEITRDFSLAAEGQKSSDSLTSV
jgi:hypothetical protein